MPLSIVTEPDTGMIGSVQMVGEIPRPSASHHNETVGKRCTQSSINERVTAQKTATKADCPPELRPIVEAGQRCAAETAANLALYSAAISGVEATIFPLTNGSNRQFLDSMRVYLRAAIAQYMATGPASTPPVLPRRPTPGAYQFPPSQRCL
ncbi:EKA-like protein [Blumeria hordei DH14]|uniref:EKA-like protein n=1 Tax=Blumeria graminis f. sp. hordei (strain DH14) TaxID=546991 RepID=N1JBT4_BLUG1|nr:EKA-like protein [Blumeria hordei DH14]